jgi:hypothetical protein
LIRCQFLPNLLVFIPRDASKRQAKRENLEIRLSSDQIHKVIEAAKNQKSLTYKKVRSIAGISEDYVPKYTHGKKMKRIKDITKTLNL